MRAHVLTLVLFVLVAGPTASRAMPARRPETTAASPAPPAVAAPSASLAAVADSVAALFDTHQFVFICSTHGGTKVHEFLLCLLSRPAFQRRVTDVLVEWANPVHQALADRYLLKLEAMPVEALTPIWFDTDAPNLWARLPQIPEFYAAVRAINTGLKPARRLRVLGGCEPIDWSKVTSAADVARYPYKNNWAAHVIAAHFADTPERRLLVVYGDGHTHHNGGTMMAELDDKVGRDKLCVLGTIVSPDTVDAERVARLGDAAHPFFLSRRQLPASGPYPRDLFYAKNDPLATHVDALAYLGPEPDRDLSHALELTAAQRADISQRDALKGDLRQLMQLRLQQRANWFVSHPNDLPPRP